jgi:hypothetical protein
VGPRTVLDAVVKTNIPSPPRESNPRTPLVQPLAQRSTDWAITAPVKILVLTKGYFYIVSVGFPEVETWISTYLKTKTWTTIKETTGQIES